jgi:hypothetical protein
MVDKPERDIYSLLKDGMMVEVDGDGGLIILPE